MWSVAFSPDGRQLASWESDGIGGTVRLWDVRTGKELLALRERANSGGGGAAPGLAFSPDGRRLVSWGRDNKLHLWDPRSGEEVLTLLSGVHLGRRAVAFSPDSTRLASGDGGGGGTVMVWDARTGEKVLALKGHTLGRPIWSVAFTRDGASVVSSDVDGRQLAWDARTGRPLANVPRSLADEDPARSADGRYFAWIDGNVIRLMDLHLSKEELVYRRRLTRHDPDWHAAEAGRLERSGDRFAAGFHRRLVSRRFPE
jgi:WD40 repeat protein